MADHGARDHAVWSASATARNVHCPGALTLSLLAPPQKSSIYADTGTAGHQIAERCLREGGNAIDYLGTVEKTKDHDITVDEDLVNSTQEYIDYVRERQWRYEKHIGGPIQLWLEERFSLDQLAPPFEAGGTGDAILYCAETQELEIVDFKNGRGVVDAEGNPQLRTYALGALLAHQDLDVETVTVTIVQPRAAHKDGRIRSETFHVADLIAWTADLLKSMARSKQAKDEFDAAAGNSVLVDEWVEKWLRPGKCVFCPVEGNCPKNRADAISKIDPDIAAKWFEAEAPVTRNSLPPDDPARVAADLDAFDAIEAWIKARRALAHTMAENGIPLPTSDGNEYHLADKIGHRKWKGEDASVVSQLSHDIGLTEDEIYDRKLRSPAQIDKVLGAKRKGLVENLWEKPVTGKNLVRSDKTTRPKANSKVEDYFEAK